MNQSNAVQKSPSSICSEEVAKTAYLLWEKEGRDSGREVEYWLRAEAQLREAQKREFELLKASAELTASTEKSAQKKKLNKQPSVYA